MPLLTRPMASPYGQPSLSNSRVRIVRNLCIVVRNPLVTRPTAAPFGAPSRSNFINEIVRRTIESPRASSSALTLRKIDIRKV
jgi:hypothetical protein